MEKSIFDTGFLLAVFDKGDKYHQNCLKIYQSEFRKALLPDVVLPELAYLIRRELNLKALITFLRLVAGGEYELVRTTEKDLERAAEILEQYDDNNIDLVDAVIAAMAERLKIEKILTVDRRHFGAFRPVHCAAFQMLP
ncbi:MAG: PIN domain-containing protein [Pyrinomonadaceae bacterium]|nr:PIN domain-containing protein [Pyrinomonadaceae bacterium]